MDLKYMLVWIWTNQRWYVLSHVTSIVLLILQQGMDKYSNCCNLRHPLLAWTLLSRLRRVLHQHLTSMSHSSAINSIIIARLVKSFMKLFFVITYISVRPIAFLAHDRASIVIGYRKRWNKSISLIYWGNKIDWIEQWTKVIDKTDNGQWLYHKYLVRFSLQNCLFIPLTINRRYRDDVSRHAIALHVKNRKHTRKSAIASRITSQWLCIKTESNLGTQNIDNHISVRFNLWNCMFIPHMIISMISWWHDFSCYCFAC